MTIATELLFLGDRSSSMESMGDAPWKGAMEWANTQAEEAKKNNHEACITLVAFDDISERVLDAVSTKNWEPLKDDQVQEWFAPRGCTRLYDTVIEELNLLQKRKLRYYGHVKRKNNILTTALEGRMRGKRPRGRPRNNWFSDVKEWTGLSAAESTKRAAFRNLWSVTTSQPPQRR